MLVRPVMFAVSVLLVSAPMMVSAQPNMMQGYQYGCSQCQPQGVVYLQTYQQPTYGQVPQYGVPLPEQVYGCTSPEGFPGVTAVTPYGVDPVDGAPLIDRPMLQTQQYNVVRGTEEDIAKLRKLIKEVILKGRIPGDGSPSFGFGLTDPEADALIQAYLEN